MKNEFPALNAIDEATLEQIQGGGRRYVEQGDGSINTIEISGCSVIETIDAGAFGVFKAFLRICMV